MIRVILFVCLLMGSVTGVMACPTAENPSIVAYTTSGGILDKVQTYPVIASGSQHLNECGFNYFGRVTSSPDFEFSINGLESYDPLNLRVEGACDTVLLVNDANGTWHFNDDSAGRDPSISIATPPSGVYEVWVGTFSEESCDAMLTLETF